MCVLANKICETYQKRLLFCRLCHARGWGLGVKNLISPDMVIWHIKLKGMVSRK